MTRTEFLKKSIAESVENQPITDRIASMLTNQRRRFPTENPPDILDLPVEELDNVVPGGAPHHQHATRPADHRHCASVLHLPLHHTLIS